MGICHDLRRNGSIKIGWGEILSYFKSIKDKI